MKERYRIGIIVPGIGMINRGTERFVVELTQRLQNKYDINIFCRREISSHCRKIRTISRDCSFTNVFYGIPCVKRLLNFCCLDPLSVELLSANVSAFRTLFRGKFDLIISVTEVWGALCCNILRMLRGIPFIVIQQAQYGKWELWSASQRPDAYIAHTQMMKRSLNRRFKQLRITYIPNAVDIEQFVPSCQLDPYNLQRPIFLAAGAFEPVKRMDLAIKAVAKLERGSLLLVGDGELKHDLLNLGEKLLGEKGRFFLTSASFSEMPFYYNLCDVFTLPSSGEAFGNVYIEAMACNKPIVTTYDETRRELIEDAGMLCDCSNIEEYAFSLEEAERTDFNDRPRKRAEAFSWENVSKKYDEMFKLIIENSKKRDA
ncbi:MAG: glycosyltransferase family 4 protein [Deltaproteobacteria bacterium]|nr:glycosyltransferase family 4 protein [Deltaproteobacteria bacterium]